MSTRRTKFVDAKKRGFMPEPRYYFYGWASSSLILMREPVARALKRAKRLLPKGYNFKIWDCKRSYKTQALMLKSFKRRLKLTHPRISNARLSQKLYTYGGKLTKRVNGLGTHRHGGAVDLTIIDKSGDELNMGTDHDDLTEKAAPDYYEEKKYLSKEEKKIRGNRRLLKRAMIKAGFKPYKEEWWHWSYDK